MNCDSRNSRSAATSSSLLEQGQFLDTDFSVKWLRGLEWTTFFLGTYVRISAPPPSHTQTAPTFNRLCALRRLTGLVSYHPGELSKYWEDSPRLWSKCNSCAGRLVPKYFNHTGIKDTSMTMIAWSGQLFNRMYAHSIKTTLG